MHTIWTTLPLKSANLDHWLPSNTMSAQLVVMPVVKPLA